MANRHFLGAGLAAAAVALILAACGSATVPGSGGQGTGGAGQTPPTGGGDVPTPAGSSAGPVTGHVGDKLTFKLAGGFDTADGTLVKVFDPATPNNAAEAPLEAEFHWVGVEVILDNHSTDYGSEASKIDGVTSAGTRITTDDSYQGGSYVLGDGFQGCTQTPESEQDAQPYTHCWAFPVPDGQTLTQVGVKVGGAEIDSSLVPTDQAVWTIP